MDKIAPYYKAVTALLVPFLASLGSALADSSDGGSKITTTEWLSAIAIGLIAGGAVFAVPNKDPLAAHQDESVQPPERGEANTGLISLICLIIIAVAAVIYIVEAL